MKNKTIVFASIAMAVFLLVIGTGIVTNVFAKNSKSVSTAPNLQEFLDREKEYQKLINEANQRIELANQQITDLVKSSSEQTPSTESPYLFSSEQAMQIASNLTGTEPDSHVELVDFNGIPAYEVVFSDATFVGKVYVDANTGTVLYNGLQKKNVYISTADAIAIATNYLGGGTIFQVYFDLYDGSQVYVVQFTNGQSVYVDLFGKIKAVQIPPSAQSSDDESHESEPDDD